MNKVLCVLLMLLMANAARAIEIPAPLITITEGEEYYYIDAEVVGDYELRVFCDNAEVSTPYAIERLDEDKEYVIRAMAQLFTDGVWYYSDVVEFYLLVPAREDILPGPPPLLYKFKIIINMLEAS